MRCAWLGRQAGGGAQVLVSDPKELEKIRDRESDITKERIQKVLAANAHLLLSLFVRT